MSLFRLDASLRLEGSHTRDIADIVEQRWRAGNPGDAVSRRDVGLDPLPATAWRSAVTADFVPAEQRSAEQRSAIALATALADELLAADAYVFALPLYNFGVPQGFKTWVDLVVTDPRFGAGAEPLLAGRPAVAVVARGGAYGSGTPREGWDHSTPWIRRILVDSWRLDLELVEVEFTLAGVVPALAEFLPLAQEMRAAAERRAHDTGGLLGRRTTAA